MSKVKKHNLDIELLELVNRIDSQLEQNEYQTATISGTQIRLEKQSNSNRLFFKLNSNLSGSITVSTDSGATSKNLVDIDSNPVTSLEKGFHEIVLTGNFFTLRNRGLSQADLQALITITNEAEANDSTLRSDFVTTVNELEVATPLNSDATWNQILLKLPEINGTKKRSKSGVATSSSAPVIFEALGQNTFNLYSLEVTGLTFKPSRIVVVCDDVNAFIRVTVYSTVMQSFNDVCTVHVTSTSSGELPTYAVKVGVRAAYVNDTGFCLPVNVPQRPFTWYAYE